MPSIVVTCASSACTASTVQLLTASPFRWTVHAPQLDVSQPMCVPVRPSVSRRKCTRSRRGSTSWSYRTPFTVIETRAIQRLLLRRDRVSETETNALSARAVISEREAREQQPVGVLDALELHAHLAVGDPHDAGIHDHLVAGHGDRQLEWPLAGVHALAADADAAGADVARRARPVDPAVGGAHAARRRDRRAREDAPLPQADGAPEPQHDLLGRRRPDAAPPRLQLA